MTTKQIKAALDLAGVQANTFSCKNGVYTIRREFFYTNGFTADLYAAGVLRAFPRATIVDKGEVWKPFRGGASTANSSHWFVKFTLPQDQA